MTNLNSQEIINRIKPFSIVTFDVFDTLVKRDATSFRDIVSLMDHEYFAQTQMHLPFYFYRERIHAPKPAKKKSHGREASIENIYDVLHLKDKKLIQSIECKTEIRCAVQNPVIYEVYQYCLKSRKKIYAISDMYLPEKCIRQILEKCGYDIEHIYVSQEYNASKYNSKLFELFLSKNKLRPDEVIHIGDNYKADICGAEKAGISSVLIPNLNNRLRYTNSQLKYSLKQNVLYKSVNNRLDCMDNMAEQTGYEVLGPVLYYFTEWLHRQLRKNNISKIYFLSRDGYLIKKAYESLYAGEHSELYYLFLSSKSVKNAILNHGEQKSLLVQYLKQNKMYGKCAIIDIGWSGRLHKMLQEIASDFAELYGFYFGTFKAFYQNVHDGISDGYLNVNHYRLAKVFMNAGFIEFLFSDTLNGTTEGYKEVDGMIQPLLSDANPNGEILRSIQKGALQFVNDWKNSDFAKFTYTPDNLIAPLLNFCLFPKPEDLELLSGEFVGSGLHYEYVAAAKKNNLNPFIFFKELQHACWKGGFLTTTLNNPIVNKVYELINPILLLSKV